MGRRRAAGNVEQECFLYQGAHREARARLYKKGLESVIDTEVFEALAKPLRNAVRKANLKLQKGTIMRKNNQTVSQVLFFPEKIEKYPFDDPAHNEYLFHNTLVVRVEYDKERATYRLKARRKMIAKTTQRSLYQICLKAAGKGKNFNLTEWEFEELIRQYAKEFLVMGLASTPHYMSEKWLRFEPDTQLVNGKKIWKFKNFTSNLQCKKLFYLGLDDEKVCSSGVRGIRSPDFPIESLLFAATLFSLCKSLFSLCGLSGIDYNFALQIIVGDGSFPFDGTTDETVNENCTMSFQEKKEIGKDDMKCLRYSIWTINGFLRLYCDYRISEYAKGIPGISDDEKKQFKKQECGNYRNNWAKRARTAPWIQLGFPLLYSNYHRAKWHNEIKMYPECPPQLTKADLKEMRKISCLPIILPATAPRKDYPTKNCLTITWPLLDSKGIKTAERYFTSWPTDRFYDHEYIKAFYYQFMRTLAGKERKELRKELKRSYTAALKTIAMRSNTPTKDEEHKACLLGALYFAWNTCKATEDQGLNRYKRILQHHIENAIKILGRVATAKDFALCVRDALWKKAPIIFYWDKDGIYLYYKEYWDSFMDYCEKRGVSLPYSAGMFRREVLAPQGYIRPQYRSQRPNAQIRYDYRKKNQKGEEATVLNVSLDILRLAYPKIQDDVSGIELLHRSTRRSQSVPKRGSLLF